MRRISSRVTCFHKRIFPIFWFGFLGLVLALQSYMAIFKGKVAPVPFFLFPIIMALFGYFFFKKMVFNLVDEVFDGGNFLLVKNKQVEDQIQLSNIRNISMTSPQRVTLALREPSRFGNEISFLPPLVFTLSIFNKNSLVEDLLTRVEKTRNG